MVPQPLSMVCIAEVICIKTAFFIHQSKDEIWCQDSGSWGRLLSENVLINSVMCRRACLRSWLPGTRDEQWSSALFGACWPGLGDKTCTSTHTVTARTCGSLRAGPRTWSDVGCSNTHVRVSQPPLLSPPPSDTSCWRRPGEKVYLSPNGTAPPS